MANCNCELLGDFCWDHDNLEELNMHPLSVFMISHNRETSYDMEEDPMYSKEIGYVGYEERPITMPAQMDQLALWLFIKEDCEAYEKEECDRDWYSMGRYDKDDMEE